MLDAPRQFPLEAGPAIDGKPSAFSELARMLRWQSQDAILMLEVYFDESGDPTNPQDRTLAIAGCVAKVETWAAWENEWWQLLADFSLSWFHTVDFESGEEEFKSWDKGRSEDFRRRLLALMSRTIDRGFRAVGCVIRHHHVPREERARRGTIRGLDPESAWSLIKDDPWFVCLAWCLLESARLARDISPDGRICVVFARKEKLSGKAAEFYREIILQFPALERRIKTITFHAEPREIHPLQAADLVAWHLRRYNSQQVVERPRPEHEVLRRYARFHRADPPRMFEGWMELVQ